MNDGKSIGPREPGDERRGYTLQGFADLFSVSMSLIKRAVSHGVIEVIYLGDRPIVRASEAERISREGLHVPPGYRAKTAVPGRGGAASVITGGPRDSARASG